MEQSGSGRVDRAREKHEPFGEDVRCEPGVKDSALSHEHQNSQLSAPQDSVTIHASVLEIDSGGSSSCYDNLQLVVPPVGAGSYLHAILQIVSTTEEVVAQLSETVGVRVVQAYDK